VELSARIALYVAPKTSSLNRYPRNSPRAHLTRPHRSSPLPTPSRRTKRGEPAQEPSPHDPCQCALRGREQGSGASPNGRPPCLRRLRIRPGPRRQLRSPRRTRSPRGRSDSKVCPKDESSPHPSPTHETALRLHRLCMRPAALGWTARRSRSSRTSPGTDDLAPASAFQ
jgi:hypothetical protein